MEALERRNDALNNRHTSEALSSKPPLKKCITFLCICVKGEMHSYLQVWHQVLLPTVPSCWPCYFLLHVLSQLSTPGMVPTLLACSVKVQDSKATLSFM